MSGEQIAIIQEFLTRGELRLNRSTGYHGWDVDLYQILSVDENGKAEALKNPLSERRKVEITLTTKEIASLASLCFPPEHK